jgi:hypothetical protein
VGGGEIFRTRPDRPWGPFSLLYNGYRVSHPPRYSAEVKERVELDFCFPSGPSWPSLGRPLSFLWATQKNVRLFYCLSFATPSATRLLSDGDGDGGDPDHGNDSGILT